MTNFIKELKALDAKATSAPWGISHRSETTVSANNDRCICSTGGSSDNRRDPEELLYENKANAELIAYNRNLLPDLIHVIELAEEVLQYTDVFIPNDTRIKQALAEIRELKGK